MSLASFNVHCGVDGWGRPFDVVAGCAALDADVLVLQETWTPDGGAPGLAELVAGRLGYERLEVGLAHGRLAHGRLADADPGATDRWGPPVRHRHDTLRLDGPRPGRVRSSPERPATSGTWGLALLTRVPATRPGCTDLGRLPKDPARRAVLQVTVTVAGRPVTVFGTHMSHLLQRSPVQYRRLRAVLPTPDRAAVLAGDMNLWGPAVCTLLPGWRRAVRGRSWPSNRPHSQLDHVLVTPPVSVVSSGVGPSSGSDHRPVLAAITVGSGSDELSPGTDR